MKRKKIEVNGHLINIDDILEISKIVTHKESADFPLGFSIVLQNNSIINVVAKPHDTPEDLVSLYQMIKNYLLLKTYTDISKKS